MGALTQSIKTIGLKMYTLEEFPFLNRDTLPQLALSKIGQLKGADLENCAIAMAGKELDALILDLKNIEDEKTLEAVIEILKLRYSPRLLKLITRLYQYNLDSLGLKQGIVAMGEEGEKRNHFPSEGKFIFSFAKEKNIFEAIGKATDEIGGDIDRLCEEYAIDPKSPLAQKVFLSYMEQGNKSVLMQNKEWLLGYLENEDVNDLIGLIKNYLGALTISEYSRRVNLMILEKLGDPYESPNWEGFTRQEKEGFAQWNFIYKLKIHTANYPQKYALLSNYYKEIRSCTLQEDKMTLTIDFGHLVIIDMKDKPYSYVLNKTYYEEQIKDKGEDCDHIFYQRDWEVHTISARDFIIENKEEKCMKLTYQGIESLYLNEMLDIKMGIQPDLRKKVGIGKIKS